MRTSLNLAGKQKEPATQRWQLDTHRIPVSMNDDVTMTAERISRWGFKVAAKTFSDWDRVTNFLLTSLPVLTWIGVLLVYSAYHTPMTIFQDSPAARVRISTLGIMKAEGSLCSELARAGGHVPISPPPTCRSPCVLAVRQRIKLSWKPHSYPLNNVSELIALRLSLRLK